MRRNCLSSYISFKNAKWHQIILNLFVDEYFLYLYLYLYLTTKIRLGIPNDSKPLRNNIPGCILLSNLHRKLINPKGCRVPMSPVKLQLQLCLQSGSSFALLQTNTHVSLISTRVLPQLHHAYLPYIIMWDSTMWVQNKNNEV